MAALGIEAIKTFADTGEKPKATEGKDFFDTGVALVTDKPAAGVESIDTKAGKDKDVYKRQGQKEPGCRGHPGFREVSVGAC